MTLEDYAGQKNKINTYITYRGERMESIQYIIDQFYPEIILGFIVIDIGILVLLFVNNSKIKKLNKKYRNIFKGQNVENIETMLLSNRDELLEIKSVNKVLMERLNVNESSIQRAYSKSSIYKYDAFSGLAGKLSFVYVLLNHDNSGVILNGIFSNEGHYLYIKDVIKGKTEKELSKEEKMTLEKVILQ